ncbi:MAG: hypothetical protein HY904_19895 [Deltaproteobacteria bacterium]|nr:hypothetical protein [Deltaproteobacteria bacterium]
MFVVLLRYTKPLAEVDRLMDRHVAFLEPHLRAGTFAAAGRQLPRTGGVILARGLTRDALEALLQTDPFVQEGAATFEIVEFRTSLHHREFARWADPKTRTVGG